MQSFILDTPNLLLRPLTLQDAPAMLEYRSDPEVARYQSWEPQNLSQVTQFVQSLQDVPFNTPDTWYQLGIVQHSDQLLVGDCGLHFMPDGQQVELGITLHRRAQGKGYAVETWSALITYLFTNGKHRIFGSADPRNTASCALMSRVGMLQEAHFRQSLWFKGEWADDVVYAILRDEWENTRKG